MAYSKLPFTPHEKDEAYVVSENEGLKNEIIFAKANNYYEVCLGKPLECKTS